MGLHMNSVLVQAQGRCAHLPLVPGQSSVIHSTNENNLCGRHTFCF